MAFYNMKKLENDFDYIVDSYADIREKELLYIEKSELYSEDIDCLNILKNHDLNWLIESMEDFFPKTLTLLKNRQIKYQVAFRESFAENGKIVFSPFFSINERVYWITLPAYAVGNIRESISHGMCRNLGGMMCTDSSTPILGKTLISEPTHWQSFDDYLSKKNKKRVIQTIVSRIPYAYEEENAEAPQKYKVKGFPNLRVFLDSREPEEQQTEYDLLLTCYDYNQNIYWVKNGDFENEIYLLSNPETAIDEYMVHVFSQAEGRFDFSPWASKLEETDIIHQIEEPEDEVEEEPEGIPLLDPELAAKLGNIPAQIKLGVDYSLGRNDVEKDPKRGRDWFWKSAKFGNLLAQYNWASYWSKEPVYLETELTSTLLESLQMQGNLAATYMLGVFSEEGIDGVEQSYPLAVHFYTYAAEQGFAPAINNLADKYENGLGVEQDLPKAAVLYTKAAEKDIGAAQWSLGLMYLEGKGVTQDQTKAKQWLEKAAGNGWDQAVELLKTF